MEKSDFDRLLERYLTGNVTDQEKKKIDTWLDVAKTQGTGVHLTREDEQRLFEKISAKIATQEEIIGFKPASNTKSLKSWITGIAATLLLMIVGSFSIWMISGSVSPSIDVEKIILNDGTLVWLRKDSKLNYHEEPTTNTRRADFAGQALFEVAKDNSRPFIITSGDYTIKVLGTSFSLRTTTDSLELIVLTGKVNVSSTEDHGGQDLKPNQKIICTQNGSVTTIATDASDLSTIPAFEDYTMRFSNARLSHVIERIEQKFDVTIKASKDLGNCRLTGDFTDQSLETTLDMISEVLEVSYTRSADQITINGKGCP
jgi:transmembrane sensor